MPTPPSLHALALIERGPLAAIVLQIGPDTDAADFARVEYVNRRFARLLGRSRPDLLEQKLTDFIPEGRQQHFLDILTTGIATGAWPAPLMQPFVHADDRLVLLRLQVSGDDLLADSDGSPRQLLIFGEASLSETGQLDLIEVRNRDLQRRTMELKTVTASLNGVVSTLAGPVSNYLAGLIGAARALEEMADDASSRGIARIAEVLESSESIRRLLEDLVAQKQIQTGQRRMLHLLLDLQDTLEDAVEGERRRCDAKGVTLEVVPPDDTVTFRADPKALHTVIGNLLSNARKFTPAEGRVRVIGRLDGQLVTIRIEDSGVGIHPDQIPRLFDVSGPTTTPGTEGETGTGFGLALAQELVAAHGGVLLVESTPGSGSAFTIRLPMSPPADP